MRLLEPCLVLVLGLLLAASPGAAQGPGLGADGKVGMRASIRSGVSPVVGRTLPFLAIGGALRLSPLIELGGEGVFGLRRLGIAAEASPERAEVTLGYGGVRLRYHLRPSPDGGGWSGELLLGAGTARMYSALVEAGLGSENFVVVEPALAYRRGISGRFAASLDAGYRFTPGAEPLPGLSADDFQGPTLSLSVSFVRDP